MNDSTATDVTDAGKDDKDMSTASTRLRFGRGSSKKRRAPQRPQSSQFYVELSDYWSESILEEGVNNPTTASSPPSPNNNNSSSSCKYEFTRARSVGAGVFRGGGAGQGNGVAGAGNRAVGFPSPVVVDCLNNNPRDMRRYKTLGGFMF